MDGNTANACTALHAGCKALRDRSAPGAEIAARARGTPDAGRALMRTFEWKTTVMAAAAMALGAVGCGSSGGGSSGSSNTCYDAVIGAAQSCVPAGAALGVLDDAGTTCAYAGGDRVTFALPEMSGISNFVLDSAGGSLCMSYQSDDAGFTLRTAAGTAVRSSTGRITCPNGVEYTGNTPAGSVSAYGAGAAMFTLVTADGGLTVFDCASK
jgi:hypothetical protein